MLCQQCNKNDMEETIKMASCNKIQHDVAACWSMLQTYMLPPLQACCSQAYAACWSMLQPEMLLPV